MLKQKTLDMLKCMSEQSKIDAVNNTDEQALNVQSLYPDWESDFAEGDTLTVDTRVNYLGVLYKVLTEHQKQETWNPVDAPSLFAQVLIPVEDVIPEWVQPDSTNGYMTGDKVTHNGVTYESLVDNNVWEPGATGTESLWQAV